MKSKFTIEKNYNISIIAEGLDVNEAEVEFCLLLDDFKLSLPLKNIKENVFRLRIPSKIKNNLKGLKEVNYSINVKNDNLIFEVARAKFELEMLTVKAVEISEAEEDDVEDIIIEHNVVKIDAAEDQPVLKKKIVKESNLSNRNLAQQLITEMANKNVNTE